MTIEEFVKMAKDEAVRYDFKDFWLTLEEKNRILCIKKCIDLTNPIEKVLVYKHYAPPSFDCDCCGLMNKIYEKLWGCIRDEDKSKTSHVYSLGDFNKALEFFDDSCCWQNNFLERDTMNSFFTIYKFALQICLEKKVKFNGWPSKSSIPDLLDDFDYHRKIIIEKSEDLYKALEDYASLVHSIGNFTMLINPNTKYKRFNTRRIFKTYDNWDLSLLSRDTLKSA